MQVNNTLIITGTDGINVFYENGALHAEARAGDKMWSVSSPQNFLSENLWNTIIVAWSPIRGLLLGQDAKNYLVARDMNGRPRDVVCNSATLRFPLHLITATISSIIVLLHFL